MLLFDALSLSVTNIVQAHKTPLACLALNAAGTLLATASDKGTVIRVFSLPNGDKVGQYRRGSYPARIYSISFNAVSSLLAASSDTETIHIFKLTKTSDAAPSSKTTRRGALNVRSTSDYGSEDGEASSSGGTLGRYSGSRSSSSSTDTTGGYEAFIDNKRNGSNGVGCV